MSGVLGAHLGERFSIQESIEFAEFCDLYGFDSIWTGEGRLARDGIVPAGVFADRTSRVRVGTGVVNNRSRNVALMAVTFKTLFELAPSRIICGLGAWWEPLASKVGLPLVRPVDTMREYVTVLRGLFRNELVSFDGEFVKVDEIRFDSMYRENVPVDIPIYFGSVGPKMLELAGEIADGVYLDFLLPPGYLSKAKEWMSRGLERRNDGVTELDITQIVSCSVDKRNPEDAFNHCKAFFTLYLCQQPHIGTHAGVDAELVERMKQVAGWPAKNEDIRRAMELLPDRYVRTVSACGSPSQAVETLEAYLAAGVRVAVVSPLGDIPQTMHEIARAFVGRH